MVVQHPHKVSVAGSSPAITTNGGYSQVVKAPGCDSGIRRFDPDYPPQFLKENYMNWEQMCEAHKDSIQSWDRLCEVYRRCLYALGNFKFERP